ncbi:hypothetical protein [Paenisporosarcina indica]|nr:hypothetical protein [Paenisporosarcina indica]
MSNYLFITHFIHRVSTNNKNQRDREEFGDGLNNQDLNELDRNELNRKKQ